MKMEHILFILKSNQFLKASIKYGVREWELHKPNFNLANFCATKLEVSVVPPPHLFSFLFLFDKKKTRKQVQQDISNKNNFYSNIKNGRRIAWWNSNMIWKEKLER